MFPTSFLARHAQITQNKKFVCLQVSLQYFKENVRDEFDFLPAVNCQSFLQIDLFILGLCDQVCPNYPKRQVCYFFAMS